MGKTTFSAIADIMREATKRLRISITLIDHMIMNATDEDLDFFNQAYLASDRDAAMLIINKYI